MNVAATFSEQHGLKPSGALMCASQFEVARSLEGDDCREPGLQYIVTTTEAPPPELNRLPWVLVPVFDGSIPDAQLFWGRRMIPKLRSARGLGAARRVGWPPNARIRTMPGRSRFAVGKTKVPWR